MQSNCDICWAANFERLSSSCQFCFSPLLKFINKRNEQNVNQTLKLRMKKTRLICMQYSAVSIIVPSKMRWMTNKIVSTRKKTDKICKFETCACLSQSRIISSILYSYLVCRTKSSGVIRDYDHAHSHLMKLFKMFSSSPALFWFHLNHFVGVIFGFGFGESKKIW